MLLRYARRYEDAIRLSGKAARFNAATETFLFCTLDILGSR